MNPQFFYLEVTIVVSTTSQWLKTSVSNVLWFLFIYFIQCVSLQSWSWKSGPELDTGCYFQLSLFTRNIDMSVLVTRHLWAVNQSSEKAPRFWRGITSSCGFLTSCKSETSQFPLLVNGPQHSSRSADSKGDSDIHALWLLMEHTTNAAHRPRIYKAVTRLFFLSACIHVLSCLQSALCQTSMFKALCAVL